MLSDRHLFSTNKTQAELDAMSDEEYFCEVVRGFPPINRKTNSWWKNSIEGCDPINVEELKAIYDECSRNC